MGDSTFRENWIKSYADGSTGFDFKLSETQSATFLIESIWFDVDGN